MVGRNLLPHQIPEWVDTSAEAWFVTICSQDRGFNQLANPDIGPPLLESVAYRYNMRQWYPHIFLLMPDHCHALLSFPGEASPAKIIRDWKHWTAARYGIYWQIDFFDHRVRGEGGFNEKLEYIRQNPVRVGLAGRVEDWPFVWSALDAKPSHQNQ